ncbi:YihA family ribosome biogenesis GTP-binding protein [Belnapia sp. T6]|uniref:Probable GTP-binding protein EngB n=1 Tax=Belnapia mucosa TaxID=2804532 RepID=A0ABS1V2D7_9PROT|nr:ribosome biogenesis GTP-binding protein YihA/YsxC [Belnapia mucosa]MBL6455855.1 YihA family ribosome biogenesis GTP-binding protein [Belnapia mucosa]
MAERHLPVHPAVLAGGLSEARTEAERAALIEAGRLLFAQPCEFFFAAQQIDKLPPAEGPEIAFCGRSNVGKSSLVNALTGQNALARVSHTPGRTKQLNFFNLGDRLTLVDMPGYGYAQASKSVKADWQGLMFDFLRGRPTLRRVLLLLDARIETKPADRMAMELLNEAAVAFQIVITKADDAKPWWLKQRIAEAEALARAQTAGHPLVLVTSSRTGEGIPELRAEMASLARPA